MEIPKKLLVQYLNLAARQLRSEQKANTLSHQRIAEAIRDIQHLPDGVLVIGHKNG